MAGNNGTEYFPGWSCRNFEYSQSGRRRKRERDHHQQVADPVGGVAPVAVLQAAFTDLL